MPVDQDKLGELAGTFVTDLGATIAAGNIVVGPEPAGFTRFRRATGTPFNAIYEARP